MALNVELLEQSFKLVAPQGEKLVARFYERLFQKYPAVKPLFKKVSMKDQKKKLLASLVLVIQNLRHPNKLTSALQNLGARHVCYGAQPAHYDAVGENLLAVLGEFAGAAWTPQVKQAWTEAYGEITTIMLEGARIAAPRPAHTQGGAAMAKGTAIKQSKKTVNGNDLSAKVDAINKVQAVIEFNLDGTVLTANDNFCQCLGYSLEEIKGKHHRMFCDTVYTNSPEYANFWAKLSRGEFDAGVYKRLGKGGKEVWIQASYNPILDANGKPYKVVKFATDVTAQKNTNAEFEGKIAAISKAQAVIEFNLDGTVITANDNFCQCLGYSLEEIKGKHHRMFCDTAYTAGGEYRAFWEKLNRGEFDAGVYKRLGKGGKEIWIQASYNPILDANGKPYKVVKFATDVTEAKKKELVKSATDNSTSNILMCDRNLTVTYINKAASDKLKALEGEIRKVLPSFNADKIVGTCIDGFHKNPSHQRRILEDPKNLPHRAEIKLGPLMLSLTVSAIVSEKGEYLGNTLEWADITAQKQAQAEVQRLIGAAVEGRLSERAPAETFEGFYRSLAEGINQMLDALVDRLTKVVGAVKTSTESVSTGSGEISQGTEDLSQRTAEQASALEETSSAMEEMTSTVKQNADNAKQANQLASAARDVAEQGGQVTVRAVAAMGEINKSSKKIADIITVIDEIAFQTNLLALNAAVEAARAGEHGRGFAVVAAEVRNLAQRSATAAKEIKTLINESIQRVTDGSDLVNQSGKTLEEIVSSVKRVADIVSEISAASQEQTTGIEQTNKAIMQMDETTQQNAALVEESASACQNLAGQAQRLMRLMESFKMKDGKVAEMTAIEEQVEETPVAKAAVQVTKKPSHPVSGHRPQAATRRVASAAPAKVGAGVGKHEGNGHHVGANEFEEF